MSEHRGGTDTVNKVTLPSAIQRARWAAKSAVAGETASGEVYTIFVGDGSEVAVEVRTRSGKTVGKAQGEVGLNRCLFTFKIPADVTEEIYFEAQLAKHGLKARSELLVVLPPRSITNARWDKKEARRGDILKMQADTKGIPNDSEVAIEIFEHDSDGAHDLVATIKLPVKSGKVESEWEYVYFEDTDDIASKEEAEKGYKNPEYFFRVSSGGTSADSGLLLFKDYMEIELKDETGEPVPDEEYVVKLPDGSERKGRLGKDGTAKITDVPPGPVYVEYPRLKEVR